ncbi:DUF418 domain-containing protein [Kangiella taiwanensis]|uniref:DUF418 domain-containing protein n=1 Tax=Kangiella taiwanensis TaxID=1079179 RepID=A0ABP8HVT4_9GAMM|nr:DUF418 domain-containing protein [Kangiella taiwanensis]
MTTTALTPTESTSRYRSLDLIRGIAVAGILIMNIYAFANIYAYYVNPKALGEPSTIDLVTWFVTHTFADQKFYTLFSMLFGAGIMLMAQRATANGTSPTGVHYKRMFWLLCFGVLHAIFIWYGDILVTYAITGLWVYWFARDTKASTKIIVGAIFISIMVALMTLFAVFGGDVPDEEMQDMFDMFAPSQAFIAQENAVYTSTYASQLDHRIDFFTTNLPMMALFFGLFRIGGSMLLGMGLYQLGVLTAERSRSFYIKMMVICFLIGFGIIAYDNFLLIDTEFSMRTTMLSFMSLNSFAAVFVALGYIGLFCLWVKSDKLQGFKNRLEAVGRMAFSNYISQSIICTILFYSHGFGLFAQLERYQLMLIVAVIFVAQLIWSPWWLSRFRYGPLEWLWRSLSYGKLQPFKRA